jgi:8-oxo-dGTP pyrophosphatase MutT (NUDIX family)|tara:strand:+ start:29 stop:682 length:654 start_codon:yes stop_codon:yes gene_type:complete
MSLNIIDHPKIQCWRKRVEANGNIIKNIEVLATISRNEASLFGAVLDCQLLTPEGVKVSRCVMVFGDSVAIIPVLTCSDDGEVYTLMVEQRRIVDGDYSREFPSGGIETGGDPKVSACNEIREELHLTVLPKELISLKPNPIKASSSILGDLVYYYYFERNVSLSFLKEIDGRSTGCHEENEFIHVRVLKMSEASDVLTIAALTGIKLLEKKLGRVF